MNNALFSFPGRQTNYFSVFKRSKERELLMAELKRMSSEKLKFVI